MAKIMVIGEYPPHKFKDLIKTYTSPDKPTYPDFIEKIHNWAPQTTGKYKIYAVYECPDEKIKEAMIALSKRYNFYANIEGYEYKIELLMEADEAIKVLMEN